MWKKIIQIFKISFLETCPDNCLLNTYIFLKYLHCIDDQIKKRYRVQLSCWPSRPQNFCSYMEYLIFNVLTTKTMYRCTCVLHDSCNKTHDVHDKCRIYFTFNSKHTREMSKSTCEINNTRTPKTAVYSYIRFPTSDC